jgi:hypothetical protein
MCVSGYFSGFRLYSIQTFNGSGMIMNTASMEHKMKLKNIKIQTKLSLIIGAAFIGMLAISAIALTDMRAVLLAMIWTP